VKVCLASALRARAADLDTLLAAPSEELEPILWQHREQALLTLFEWLCEGFERTPAEELTAMIDCEIDDRPRAFDRFRVRLDRGHCSVAREARLNGHERPAVTLSLGIVDFVSLVTGRVRPSAVLLAQRLTVSGDLLLAARLPQLFSFPRPESETSPVARTWTASLGVAH
jgi:putative sterol carrier protein